MTARAFARLLWIEIKLVLREPVVVIFVVAFPAVTVLILGGVFDADDPAFEGVEPSQWYVAAYLGVVIAAIGFIMLPVHIAGYRERGVLRRFQVSHFPGWALPVADVLVGLVMTVVGIATLLAVAEVSYGVPPVADVPLTVGAVVLAAACFVSIGVALGTVLPSARSAQGLGLLLFFPSFLLGGGGPPPAAMGSTMESISRWLPLTHAIRAVQKPWLGIGEPAGDLLVLAALLVVATAAWLYSSRSTTHRDRPLVI